MHKVITFLFRLATITAHNPRDLRHIFGVANSVAQEIADPKSDVRSIRSVDFSNITGSAGRFLFQAFPGVGASITLYEAAALAALCRSVNAKRIFEFGTYKGVSTTQFALNLPADGMIYTLDLPEDHPAYSFSITKEEERIIAAEGGKGVLVPADCHRKVAFLKCDSAEFDTTPYLNSMDLVFVDGAHSYEYVKNDTIKGLEMLRSGGVITWHDCSPSHPNVVALVKESRLQVNRVSGTALAFAFK